MDFFTERKIQIVFIKTLLCSSCSMYYSPTRTLTIIYSHTFPWSKEQPQKAFRKPLWEWQDGSFYTLQVNGLRVSCYLCCTTHTRTAFLITAISRLAREKNTCYISGRSELYIRPLMRYPTMSSAAAVYPSRVSRSSTPFSQSSSWTRRSAMA